MIIIYVIFRTIKIWSLNERYLIHYDGPGKESVEKEQETFIQK